MARLHTYTAEITWTGNRGTGTSDYRSYERSHEVAGEGLPTIPGSSDPAFRGDPARWNPEQLQLAALSQCHMLSYLHQCAVNGVVVTSYVDRPLGTMEETAGGGHFTEAVLRPRIEVASEEMTEKALALHDDAHRACFIAASVNFPVRHEAVVTVAAS
ncbi:OsmC family protein [Streptomyces sp. CB01881]|uniref:OsmC family protein n=1 Tax=Streptomyces sp. CB01881 TaxID=2078691 RepID=UPI000CDC7324|nr:OsmC family protein [Streptomyces sp. CB01881]AUY49353.1 peroxiredoxin [Streptomyces sp. CB01881]TYC72740.1 OsmC family peroxiredoxin [Streptomyces sp. CB01881]